MKQFFIGLFLLLAYCGVAADSFPPQFTAKYKLYAKGIPAGEGTRSLMRLPNGNFQFKTFAETTGFIALFNKVTIEERSVFMHLKNGKLRPLEYHYKQTGKKSRTNTVLFEWSKGIARNTFKGQTKVIPLKAGVLDRLLYQLVLMIDQKQGKAKIKYQIVTKGKIKSYIPKYLGFETLQIGDLSLKTVKYDRTSANGKRRTTLWCAPTLYYLPVQVEHLEKGNVFRLVLQSIKWF